MLVQFLYSPRRSRWRWLPSWWVTIAPLATHLLCSIRTPSLCFSVHGCHYGICPVTPPRKWMDFKDGNWRRPFIVALSRLLPCFLRWHEVYREDLHCLIFLLGCNSRGCDAGVHPAMGFLYKYKVHCNSRNVVYCIIWLTLCCRWTFRWRFLDSSSFPASTIFDRRFKLVKYTLAASAWMIYNACIPILKQLI